MPCKVCRNFVKVSPGGANCGLKCFFNLFHACILLYSLKRALPAERESSSMSCSMLGTSTNCVIGTAFFDFSSTKKYVPSEQCGWEEIVGTPVPRSAAVSF